MEMKTNNIKNPEDDVVDDRGKVPAWTNTRIFLRPRDMAFVKEANNCQLLFSEDDERREENEKDLSWDDVRSFDRSLQMMNFMGDIKI
eukprot:CAMPEP_0170558578 /NCGR_PEP_ID=MMETSP0211-20121228/36279_1 /TAXON_ID=311385 /ORGANISM="Pseudokeronopsis sp., Strain OXSARD2" /LENGTH=87 /DNA_ID=CAMNT_0010870653 /DNA_START=301 /DNA_END=561 /DNA_ORIENTATION=+